MAAEHQAGRLLETLMEASRSARELEAYEISYHALAAAAHAAEYLENQEALGMIERVSRDTLAEIDARHPGHRHSSSAVRMRGHRSIFEQLAITAAGMRQRIGADRRIRELRTGQ